MMGLLWGVERRVEGTVAIGSCWGFVVVVVAKVGDDFSSCGGGGR